jgi:hypothetical protein
MSSLPKEPKPHISEGVIKNVPKLSSKEREKAIKEMTKLIQENNKIEAKYRSVSMHDETLHE